VTIAAEKEDGTPYLVAGLSILYYAGNGLFCYSRDMLNMGQPLSTTAHTHRC